MPGIYCFGSVQVKGVVGKCHREELCQNTARFRSTHCLTSLLPSQPLFHWSCLTLSSLILHLFLFSFLPSWLMLSHPDSRANQTLPCSSVQQTSERLSEQSFPLKYSKRILYCCFTLLCYTVTSLQETWIFDQLWFKILMFVVWKAL